MKKNSLETKIKAVKYVVEQGMPIGAVAESLHIAKTIISRWIARYEEHGIDGLSMRPGTYSGDFKVHVVEYIRKNDMSIFRGAAHFGIPNDNTVGQWERIYLEEGPEALYKGVRRRKRIVDKVDKGKIKKPKNEKQEEDLVAEVQRLRMENEYLKKLNALVQAREKSAKKTK